MRVLKIHIIKGMFFISFLSFFSSPIYSQSNTNSPYTQYGYGQLVEPATAVQRSMGGIGYGLRNSQTINPLNPASYSAVDSLTFMLDFGISGKVGWLEQGSDNSKSKKLNAGLDYVALQFPLAKNLGLGLGFTPVSFVGYKFGNDSVLTSETMYKRYSGSGGLSKVYLALSYRINPRFSVGANAGYIFGDITRDKSSVSSSSYTHTTVWGDTLRTNALSYELGVQYRYPINKTTEWMIGAVYTPKITLDTKVMQGESQYIGNYLTGEQIHFSSTDSVFQFPETYAVGVTYYKLNKLTVGADFQYQRWADAKFYDRTNAFNNRIKINAGVEYIPNSMSNKFFKRIRYRAGAYYKNSYIRPNISGYEDNGFQDLGASLGFGIPMNDRRSFLNLAFEYNAILPDVDAWVKEQYFKFTISYTFNELWFLKRKLQ